MREFVKSLISHIISIEWSERLTAFLIIKKKYAEKLDSSTRFDRREDLWKHIMIDYADRSIFLLEFGVFEGYSMEKLSSLNGSKESKFIGFDSFEGLPENWSKKHQKGAFDVGKVIPKVNDSRVSFVVGWFQNTLRSFLEENEILDPLIVHYDADIYSATLFVMMELDRLKKPYIAIFDEFYGHETRALYNYCQMTGAEVDFIVASGDKKYPVQVGCKIIPKKIY